jgi:hypothetical protein
MHGTRRHAAVTFAVAGLLVLSMAASASAWPTYRSASVMCQNATLYGNYSPSRGPNGKMGVLVRGEVVGFQYTNGSFAMVRTGAYATLGFVQRNCITVPEPGTSASYLWPAKVTCQEATMHASYDSEKQRPGGPTSVVLRGQLIGYQYYRDPSFSSGPWATIRKGTKGADIYGYVLRSCIAVASWAPRANWYPPR